MATYNEILAALASEEAVITTADLAAKVSATQDTIRASCSQLKKKGYVDGSTKEGWLITSEGREALERREKIPLTPEDVGADTKSKLQYYGQLAGVAPDLILATCELILGGDPENLEHVWEAMTQMDVPIPNRRRWFNLWRNYLKQGIPPELREKVIGTSEATEEEAEETTVSAKEKGRDYIIADDVPVFVGHGQGDFSLKDAKDIIGMRSLRYRFTGQPGATPQAFGPKDIMDIIDKIYEGRGAGAPPKSYVVTQGEEGAVVQEIEPGQPMVLSQPAPNKPSATYVVDGEGNVRQAQPGEPIVIKQQVQSSPGKTYLVRQTPEGMVTEEFEAGKPIIINAPTPSPNSNLPPMLPFPVIGSDGQPVYDKDGKPVYANIEPMMKWMGFQSEQRRQEERHQALIATAKTFREHIGDLVAGMKVAAEEKKQGSKLPTEPQPQAFECADCHTQFGVPPGWVGEPVRCPNPSCGRVYTREELLGT